MSEGNKKIMVNGGILILVLFVVFIFVFNRWLVKESTMNVIRSEHRITQSEALKEISQDPVLAVSQEDAQAVLDTSAAKVPTETSKTQAPEKIYEIPLADPILVQ